MRVVLHFDTDGSWRLLTDVPGAVCFCVDDNAPNDRVYRMSNTGGADAIDALLAGEEAGSLNDGSGKTQRTRAILGRLPSGRPALSVVVEDTHAAS